jgi:GntR family transcriptional repressor for pyruvate dehydrogenase complex
MPAMNWETHSLEARPDDASAQPFSYIERRPTLTEEVVRRLVDVLRDGHVAPGDKLPPERRLAEMMGISRPAVREALRALSLLGIIDARPGRGTHVVESLESLPLEPYLLMLLLNKGQLLDLMEIRKILEPEMVALAAVRADDQARARIRARLTEHERLVAENSDTDVEARAGDAFHLELANAAGNAVLVRLLGSVSDIITETGRLILARNPGASLRAHRDIMRAVLARDPEAAREKMRTHLEQVSEQLVISLEADRLRTAKAATADRAAAEDMGPAHTKEE